MTATLFLDYLLARTAGPPAPCDSCAELGRKAENLETALVTARSIGAAVGIIMVTRQLTETEAFAAIRTVSQRTHIKIRDLAREVVYTGALPTA